MMKTQRLSWIANIALIVSLVSLLVFKQGTTTTSPRTTFVFVESFGTLSYVSQQQSPRYQQYEKRQQQQQPCYFCKTERTTSVLQMSSNTDVSSNLDPVTYLRTEFVSAALFTNQTPRSADVCVQLGTYDGRAVTFIPRTIRQFIPTSLQQDGKLDLKIQRAIKQGAERRDSDMKILYCNNRRADDLNDIEDNSVDVVLSMQSATKMIEEGLDWKKSIQEAGRVLKPGTGRFLFVEQTQMENGEYYLDYVMNLACPPPSSLLSSSSTKKSTKKNKKSESTEDSKVDDEDDDEDRFPLFELIGFDDVDLVLKPHVAGVVMKRADAGMTKQERLQMEKQQQDDLYAERSLQAFEKRKKKKKKKKTKDNTKDSESTSTE